MRRKTPQPSINFQIGDLFVNIRTNIAWYIVDIDIAYLAIVYLHSSSDHRTEYITKHYTEQSILEKRLLYYPVKNSEEAK